MITNPNQPNFTSKEYANASSAGLAEITFMDLAVLGARSVGLMSDDLDNATGEQLWDFIEIADSVIYAAGFALLFGIEFPPKEESPHPWTEQEEAEHNRQEPFPCHWDEM